MTDTKFSIEQAFADKPIKTAEKVSGEEKREIVAEKLATIEYAEMTADQKTAIRELVAMFARFNMKRDLTDKVYANGVEATLEGIEKIPAILQNAIDTGTLQMGLRWYLTVKQTR